MTTKEPLARATFATTNGLLRGIEVDGVHAFLGVPYAAPPVGPLRFAPPVPPAAWKGVREANQFGPTAPQPGTGAGLEGMIPAAVIEGDDCLHLNVYTPSLAPMALPVLVWIHGGGMVMGSNAGGWDQGAQLASRGMVTVSMNYRLGIDGFLPLQDAQPNRGVADWVAGLEWVRDNIAAFGGDPGNVTIGGHSAGSAACLVLLASPRAAPLFRRVIAMSGVPWNLVGAASADDAEAKADELATRLGVERTTAGIASVPYQQLFAVQDDLAPVGMIGPITDPISMFHRGAAARAWLGPVIDGDLVPEHPVTALAAGAGGAHGVMIGTTANEMDALISVIGNAIAPDQARQALREIGVDEHGIGRWFEDLDGHTPGEILGAALTALSFRLPVLRVAEARSGALGSTYVYEVTWRPPTPLGAVHGIDLPYVFDRTDVDGVALMAGGAPPKTLAHDMSGAVTGFVVNGDPGWERYDTDARIEMCFDTPSATRPDPGRTVRDVFGSLR